MTINTTTPETAHVTLGQIDSVTDAISAKFGTKLDKTAYDEGIAKKVDKVDGKQLSTNDYTTTEKDKLAAVAEGAQVNVIEAVSVNGTALAISEKGVNIDISGKVDKVEGKQLSTEDYSTTEKTKLTGIAEGAQVNVLEAVKVNGEALAITSKGVNIDLTDYVKSADMAKALTYKGSVATYADLPTKDQKIGDVYNVTAADADHNLNAGENVAWNGSEWDNLGGVTDLSGKVDKETGKGLSTNDFTDELKTKLEDIKEATSDDISKITAKFA